MGVGKGEYTSSAEQSYTNILGTEKWGTSYATSSINSKIRETIPKYSKITYSKISVDVKRGGDSLSTSNTDATLRLANEAKVDTTVISTIHSQNGFITPEYKNFYKENSGVINSGNANAGCVTSASYVQMIVSGTVRRKYYIKNFRYYVECTYPTFTINVKAGTGGTVSGGGTYDVTVADQTKTITATPSEGYEFEKWVDSNGNTYTSNSVSVKISHNSISANSTTVTYTAHFKKKAHTVTFRNADGTVIDTRSVNDGSTLGTIFDDLPTVSRSGYTFGGWIPCSPAVDLNGVVVDSRQYLGDEDSAQALHRKYKDYVNNLSVHIEAYMSDWEDIVNRQIISCTEEGGWGLGYQANTKVNGVESHGFEVHTGSYTGYDLKFGTKGVYTNNQWHAFDITFSNGNIEVFVDGVSKGTRSASSSTIYHKYADSVIFVGAEAGKSTSPSNNYFKGFISNVFIANQGSRLAIATTSTVVEGNVDYYPVWKLNPTYTITASGENGSVSGGGTYEEGKTATLTATPNDGFVFKQWSDGNTDNPRTVKVTGDATYTAEFESAMPEFTLVQMLYNNKQISKDNKVPAGQSFRLVAGVK